MKNRVKQVTDLLIEQYKKSVNLISLLTSFSTEAQELEKAYDDLLNKRSIDTAEGVNLDIIGKIIVLDRPYTDPDPETIFTFDNPGDIGGPFTDVPNSVLGGVWIGLDPQKNARYNDALYRFILRAKIIYNTGDATLPNMNAYMKFVFGDEVDFTILSRVGVIDIFVSRPIGKQERVIIEKTFPIAAGVRIGELTYSQDGADNFGFEGNSNNLGFGDLSDPAIGGGFVTLVID